MTGDEAVKIVRLPENEAVDIVLGLAEKAEKYDLECADAVGKPSGMKPPWQKPAGKTRRKKPGQKPEDANPNASSNGQKPVPQFLQ